MIEISETRTQYNFLQKIYLQKRHINWTRVVVVVDKEGFLEKRRRVLEVELQLDVA